MIFAMCYMWDMAKLSIILIPRLNQSKKSSIAIYPCRVTGELPEVVYSTDENP